ncbi:MAG TPA: 50S ribosomal protein L29 [Candidatus Bathyarchaeia archaeon]|nr:50S ribosomal protein L29 [Candidatus Bathyarchaeia archaeon]
MKEVRSMSYEDRRKKLDELRTEISRLQTMIRAGGAIENPARIHELRKSIAQVLTVENEAERAETKEKTKERESR